jgi:hypothetical protein
MIAETINCPIYTLTDATQIACHGSFSSVNDAITHARQLQEFGLCQTFTVGGYSDGKFVTVFTSSPVLECNPADTVLAGYFGP